MAEFLAPLLNLFPQGMQHIVLILIQIMLIVMPLVIAVAYTTYAERKIIGYMQVRIGPNRVGPIGLFQPFADVFKLMFKEIIIPAAANKFIFFTAPVVILFAALVAWAVVPFDDGWVIADVNAGLLYVLAVGAAGVYGVILAG